MADLTRNVNVSVVTSLFLLSFIHSFIDIQHQKMESNLTDQMRSISEVTKAVALGDLGKTVEVDVQGEMLDLKMTVNSMVVQLSTLANEVTRVSLEVRTEGILGGQAFVPDVQGMWKVTRFLVALMGNILTRPFYVFFPIYIYVVLIHYGTAMFRIFTTANIRQ